MNSLTISELAIATKGKLVIGNESDTINDVVIDSRKADKDNVFVAVIGENLDGHQFMQSAYENGCKTFIKNASSSIKLNSSDINLIEVKDTQIALGDIAKYYKEKFGERTLKICIDGRLYMSKPRWKSGSRRLYIL